MKCTNCGGVAINSEDFAVFDIPASNNPERLSRFIGLIRFRLCANCIEKVLKEDIGVNMAGVLGIAMISAIVFGVSLLSSLRPFDVIFGVATGLILVVGLPVVFFHGKVRNKKIRDSLKTRLDKLLPSEVFCVGEDTAFLLHGCGAKWEVLYDKKTDSAESSALSAPKGIQDSYRYCCTMNSIKTAVNTKDFGKVFLSANQSNVNYAPKEFTDALEAYNHLEELNI
jgi:hypothetical protein